MKQMSLSSRSPTCRLRDSDNAAGLANLTFQKTGAGQNRQWLFGLASLAIALLASPSLQAKNPEYRCEQGTVENDAVAVTYSDVDVGTFSDPNKKICKFAIGGAAGAGPTSRQDQAPVQELISRLKEGRIDQIVIRLTLARTTTSDEIDEYRNSIASLLKEHGGDLKACFDALSKFPEHDRSTIKFNIGDKPVFLSASNKSIKLFCSVTGAGKYDVFLTGVPTLQLKSILQAEGQTDSWFVPQEAARER